MRRLAMLVPLSGALLSGSLLLTACGGSSGGSSASPSTSSSASSTSSSGAELPITTEVGFTASGSYGDKPTLTFSGDPGKALGVKVVSAGTGATVKSGDILNADYLGQIWKGKVFDNSYDRKLGAAFPIGVGKVIPGWDKALVGLKIGSRVLLSIPPADGYGSTGQAAAGIKGTDTIVFVVDLVGIFSKDAVGEAKAVNQKVKLPAGLKITGKPGSPATLTAAKTYKAPAKPKVTVLYKGTGPAVTSQVLVQYAAAQPGGASESSWTSGGPQAVPVTSTQAGPFQLLKGLPVGSRVLLEVPTNKTAGTTTAVFVVDLVGVPRTAKEALAKK